MKLGWVNSFVSSRLFIWTGNGAVATAASPPPAYHFVNRNNRLRLLAEWIFPFWKWSKELGISVSYFRERPARALLAPWLGHVEYKSTGEPWAVFYVPRKKEHTKILPEQRKSGIATITQLWEGKYKNELTAQRALSNVLHERFEAVLCFINYLKQ